METIKKKIRMTIHAREIGSTYEQVVLTYNFELVNRHFFSDFC